MLWGPGPPHAPNAPRQHSARTATAPHDGIKDRASKAPAAFRSRGPRPATSRWTARSGPGPRSEAAAGVGRARGVVLGQQERASSCTAGLWPTTRTEGTSPPSVRTISTTSSGSALPGAFGEELDPDPSSATAARHIPAARTGRGRQHEPRGALGLERSGEVRADGEGLASTRAVSTRLWSSGPSAAALAWRSSHKEFVLQRLIPHSWLMKARAAWDRRLRAGRAQVRAVRVADLDLVPRCIGEEGGVLDPGRWRAPTTTRST